jgi:hypothetical protein
MEMETYLYISSIDRGRMSMLHLTTLPLIRLHSFVGGDRYTGKNLEGNGLREIKVKLSP